MFDKHAGLYVSMPDVLPVGAGVSILRHSSSLFTIFSMGGLAGSVPVALRLMAGGAAATPASAMMKCRLFMAGPLVLRDMPRE
jgi:hypothetical protein